MPSSSNYDSQFPKNGAWAGMAPSDRRLIVKALRTLLRERVGTLRNHNNPRNPVPAHGLVTAAELDIPLIEQMLNEVDANWRAGVEAPVSETAAMSWLDQRVWLQDTITIYQDRLVHVRSEHRGLIGTGSDARSALVCAASFAF